jgi:FkbM family methyltransferase
MPSHYFTRRLLNRALRPRGLSVQKIPVELDPRGSLLRTAGVRTVIDVGANVGQYGQSIRASGFRGPMLSFEPQLDAFTTLQATAATDPTWSVFKSAVGDHNGEIELNIAGNSLSSSVLPMESMHSTNAPESVYVRTEKVPIRRLDDVLTEQNTVGPYHLKLDVQGFEGAVLRGATAALQQANALEIEMSFVPLYEGQTGFDDLYAQLRDVGFAFFDVVPGFRAKDGRLLQIDGLFVRENAAPR